MLKILINNVTIITMSDVLDLVIRRGYVYVENGVIKAVGPGEPPPEYEFADYVIEGKGKVLTPSFCLGYFEVLRYPIRFIQELDTYYKLLSSISGSDIYYITSITLASLLLKGVACIGLVIPRYQEHAAKAIKEAYPLTRFMMPITIDEVRNLPEIEQKLRRIPMEAPQIIKPGLLISRELIIDRIFNLAKVTNSYIYLKGVVEEKDLKILSRYVKEATLIDYAIEIPEELSKVIMLRNIVTEDNLDLWRPFNGLGIMSGSTDVYSSCRKLLKLGHNPIDVFASLTRWGAEALGFSNVGSIEPGKIALINIFDIHSPHVWPISGGLESLFYVLVTGLAPLETVIVYDDIVIDNGELLSIGESQLQKARDRVSELLRDLGISVY